jgi:hypothetical protein
VRYGWQYEAINYDIADDAVLQRENPDMEHCASQGSTAGGEVVTADGVPIGGWYIPAADGAGPTVRPSSWSMGGTRTISRC